MSDEDDILAIVAALEFLKARDDSPPARSKWRDAALWFDTGDAERSWKNS